MDPISMLIFNALVRRQSINLPDIGSLKVIMRAPVIEKKSVLTPPVNLVIYAESEFPEFTSIVTLIAQSSNKDEAQAWEIYGRWLAAARYRRSRPDRLGGRDSRRTFFSCRRTQRNTQSGKSRSREAAASDGNPPDPTVGHRSRGSRRGDFNRSDHTAEPQHLPL